MTTDFRVLCTELVDIITAHANPDDCAVGYVAGVLTRARAALADEPASVAGQPSDEELALIYHDCCRGCEFMDQVNFEIAARAVLTRWGNPAPQLEGKVPLPSNADQAALMVILGEQWLSANAPERLRRQAPSADGRVAKLVARLLDMQTVPTLEERRLAADLLQRLSPPQPVPVSERLPGPEDCTAEGRCWLCYTNVCNVTQWSLVLRSAILDGPYSHWLPAHALPVPGQEVDG